MIPKKELRARVTRIIAATRFPFVDQTDWSDGYITIVNDDVRRRGVSGSIGLVYPSIVITLADGTVQEIGEVELEDTVTEAQISKWKLMSEKTSMGRYVKKFFLYVPEGKQSVAERLLEDNDIEYAGLRTWAIKDGNLVVTPIKTPDEPKDHR